MRFSMEEILHLAADRQRFAHDHDSLDELVDAHLSDELSTDELDYVAAARASAPTYQDFLQNTILHNRRK